MTERNDKFCVRSWRERILRIFVSKARIASSYFANRTAANPPLRLCSSTELKIYDQVAEEVWRIVNNRAANNRNGINDKAGPCPHQCCHVFPALQLLIFNLSRAAPDSFSQLDVDAFLNPAANRNECDAMSEENYSSAHRGDQPIMQNSFAGGLGGSTIHMLGTPQKCSIHRTPKQASTPCRIQRQDILELTRKIAQQEARPNPERLNAQIHSNDNIIQTLLEQYKTLFESNKTLVESNESICEKIEDLQKQFANFFKDFQQQQQQQQYYPRPPIDPVLGGLAKIPENIPGDFANRVTNKFTDLAPQIQQFQHLKFTTEHMKQDLSSPSFVEPERSEEIPKPSPYADFKFTKSNETSAGLSSGFSFVKAPSIGPATSTPKNSTSSVEATAKTSLRHPHAPVPTELSVATNIGEKSSVSSSEIRGTLNEDGEATLYEKLVNIKRSSSFCPIWENRNKGTVRILLDLKTGKLRLHAMSLYASEIICNHRLVVYMKFLMPWTINGVIIWSVEDTKTGNKINFVCLFDTIGQSREFIKLIETLQRKLINGRLPLSSIRQDGKIIRLIDATSKQDQPSLAEIFKPPADSWECGSCHARNNSAARKCLACEAESPIIIGSAAKPGDETTGDKNLWNQFKPQPESWECPSCYMRNSKENSYCVACDTAKVPEMPAKPEISGFGIKETPDLGTTGGNSVTTENTIFGGKSATHTFGNLATSDNVFGAGTTGTDATPLFGGLALTAENSDIASSGEDKTPKDSAERTMEPLSFLPLDSGATFSALAAQNPDKPTFKTVPNFSFAGAGATIFGGKASNLTSPGSAEVMRTTKKSSNEDAGDEAEEDENEDTSQEHDPQFEPLIPLPDAIEVRTGEEEEDKIFAQRAKLYRFETETKEWKERGETIKTYIHSVHGTYRLLLRREQVHKVVCNQLVTVELELKPLQSSDRAWMWVAFNHAEEPYALEQLAVRFKNPELAIQFKEAVEKAKIELQERQESGQGIVNETDSTECYAENQEDDEHSVIFSRPVNLLVLQDDAWKSLGAGTLKILYDSDIYGAKIIVEADNTGEILSNTVISIETTMEKNENSCEWTAIDEVLNPPTRRTLKAIFGSLELAWDMYLNFQDGQEYAKHADISETSYYDPRIE